MLHFIEDAMQQRHLTTVIYVAMIAFTMHVFYSSVV